MENTTTVTQILRERMLSIRKAFGYTQEQIAKVLSCSRTRIVRLESGEDETTYTAAEFHILSHLYNIPISELMSLTPNLEYKVFQHALKHKSKPPQLETPLQLSMPDIMRSYAPAWTNFIINNAGTHMALIMDKDPAIDLFIDNADMNAISDTFLSEAFEEEDDRDDEEDNEQIGDCNIHVLIFNLETGGLLSATRLRGLDYIAFLDDDCLLLQSYGYLEEDLLEYEDPASYFEYGDYSTYLYTWNLKVQQPPQLAQAYPTRAHNIRVEADKVFLWFGNPSSLVVLDTKSLQWQQTYSINFEKLEDHYGLELPDNLVTPSYDDRPLADPDIDIDETRRIEAIGYAESQITIWFKSRLQSHRGITWKGIRFSLDNPSLVTTCYGNSEQLSPDTDSGPEVHTEHSILKNTADIIQQNLVLLNLQRIPQRLHLYGAEIAFLALDPKQTIVLRELFTGQFSGDKIHSNRRLCLSNILSGQDLLLGNPPSVDNPLCDFNLIGIHHGQTTIHICYYVAQSERHNLQIDNEHPDDEITEVYIQKLDLSTLRPSPISFTEREQLLS